MIPRHAKRRLVELIGPAGVGKSALASALPTRDARIRTDLSVWGLPPRYLVGAAFGLLPAAVSALVRCRPFHGPEIAQMIRLRALWGAIRHASRRDRRCVIVLDEGPLFALAWLHVSYPPMHDEPRARWRRRELAAWTARLDVVVRLDAEDDVVVERIRRRSKPHQVKEWSTPDIHAFTARFQTAFDQIIGEVAVHGGVAVVHVRTDDGSPDEGGDPLQAVLASLCTPEPPGSLHPAFGGGHP